MKRVFYLITELDIGGAEKALYELVTRLDRSRFEPVVGCLSGHGPIGEWLQQKDVPVLHMGMRGCWDLPAWLRLRRALRETKPHVLHTFLFHANLAGRIAAIGMRLEKVISSVRVEEPRRLHLWLERLTRGLVDVVTCVSESARQYTHTHTRMPMSKLVAVPNGIDLEQPRLTVVAPPEEWRLPDGVPVIGVVGRLHEQKDPLLMLRAAQRVIAEADDAIFVFAGDGPLLERCRAEAKRLGIDRQVRWLGWQPDIRPLLVRMDLLASSAKWEGMPNVVLEAMAYSRTVVATDVGGTGEIVADGETGFVVPWNNEMLLSRRIVELLKDNDLRRRLGAAGVERIKQHFSIGRMVEANQQLYS